MKYDGVKETACRGDEQRHELKGGGFFNASLMQITRPVGSALSITPQTLQTLHVEPPRPGYALIQDSY